MKMKTIGLMLFLAPLQAFGQSTVDLKADFDSFEHVPVQSQHFFSTRTNQTLGHLGLAGGLTLVAQDDPVVMRFSDGSEWRVVDDRIGGSLYAAIGLGDSFELALSAPVVFSQSSQNSPPGFSNDSLSSVAFGDVRIYGHATLANFGGFGIGTTATVYLPTGSQEALLSDGSVRVEPRLVLDFELADFHAAANASYLVRPKNETLNYISDDQVRWSFAANYAFSDMFSLAGSVFGAVGINDRPATTARDTPIEFLAGPRVFLPLGLMMHAAAGTGITTSVGAPDFRVIAGIEWVPERLTGKYDESNEGLTGSAGADGEGDVGGEGDSETFEVIDCTATPLPSSCPQPDSDDDGILDAVDKCPTVAEDPDGFEDEDGCPDTDNDGDGVLDVDDACPLEAEVINGVEDEDGCPDEGASKVRVTADRIDILERVYFETNKDQIQAQSFSVLDQVASVMKARSDIKRLRVEGHTDDRGKDKPNLELSQRRAAAVREYLIKRGLDSTRMVSRGYGESHPIGDNQTADGRDINRRVEFHIIAEEK